MDLSTCKSSLGRDHYMGFTDTVVLTLILFDECVRSHPSSVWLIS